MEDAVRRLIDERIRPSVQLDGGDVEFVELRKGVVTVRMFGACDGCPMSPVTLRAGIERVLKEEFPQISDVVAIEA